MLHSEVKLKKEIYGKRNGVSHAVHGLKMELKTLEEFLFLFFDG